MKLSQLYRRIFPSYPLLLDRVLKNCNAKTVLDLGCGDDSPLQFLKSVSTAEKIGVDAFQPSIEKSKEKKIHDRYINSQLIDYLKNIDRSFDVVMLNDVVEHFERDDAEELIFWAERRSKKFLIILTPNGFVRQGDINKNPWQVHLSGFNHWDFEKRGFTTFPFGGLKFLRGELFQPKIPGLLGEFLCDLSAPLAFIIKPLSYSVLAVKKYEDFNIE